MEWQDMIISRSWMDNMDIIKFQYNRHTICWLLSPPLGDFFAHKHMPFELCKSPKTFSRLETNAFREYLDHTMKIFLDDFAVYSTIEKHAHHSQECIYQCMEIEISINIAKLVYLVPFGKSVDYIVSKQGVATNSNKIATIVSLLVSSIVTKVKGF